MQEKIEMEAGRIDSIARIAILAPVAARVQDLFGDLQFALLQGDDPMPVLSDMKEAWRHFRDAAMGL